MSAAVSSLRSQLDAISTASIGFIRSKLSPDQMPAYEAQFAPDKNNPYPVPAVGSSAPAFSLQDSAGRTVSLKQLVSSGRHTVLVWYRGAWCPFCSATIKSYNAHVDEFAAVNAQVVAITPTLPEYTSKTVADWALRFPVLTDMGNEVAREYGTLNQLNEDMRNISLKLGTDFKTLYGDKDSNLPHPGIFVVEANTGKLLFSRVQMDYRVRVEPDELIQLLKSKQ
jgi:peroxiredoxin